MDYLVAKWLHVLSSTILFGTGLGTAYYMFFASLRARRSGDARPVALVADLVVKADTWFTTPTIVFQPLSGWYLLHAAGYRWTSGWILWSVVLYLVAGACWLPVVWIQIRLRDMARQAAREGAPLPPAYWRRFWLWSLLGVPAFVGLVVVFYLMVAKPI